MAENEKLQSENLIYLAFCSALEVNFGLILDWIEIGIESYKFEFFEC